MEMAYTIFLFLFGLVFGSFYNVVGLRVPQKESIVQPPSHCTKCQRQLTALDLVPVLSYVFLGGKCRSCGNKIAWIYPVMELLTGLLFAFAYRQLGWSIEFIVALFFISLLVIIVVSDIAYMLIPNKVLLFFLPFLIIGRVLSPLTPWWDCAVGAVVGFGILYSIAVISNGGMGGGDIKLFFLIGLVLGTMHTLLTLFIAAVIGMIVGLVVLTKNKQGRKTPIPFGPSIALAAIIVYFYGDSLIDWYLGFW
ncbi:MULTISPECIES: A24 family peptidase [unclassified Lysinibacillus]|uniref:prepilin peptidase n=1 Tax=unclassified Lysinibacillus TaxID=2636778 RepID=UPI000884B1CE|nr:MULTISPECIES: A24 family peptidase [unclassified Lysinibacillus]WCH48909.1 prepilin peptidase [Lysinibacillus sp. OF-1]SCX89275.1 type 4 prepilin peptidase 1 Aspartic peptidase. MEROPS family A24A [Lysinibacillus sp. SG9]SDB05897.1 type 4 prepilin peptidase 1 Aspartic peptidase. MEROPS family A24A [Lysinibacillus sp. TC-37]SFS36640.1 type 4 prepilin peptidase 1 Aspartic peptidase. MEROPS family A24A [Lysinibacillus sp. SG55]